MHRHESARKSPRGIQGLQGLVLMEEKIHEKTENRIIDLINQGTGGRLVIFKPEANSSADLAVEKRGNYKKAPVFLKIYVKDALLGDGDFIKEVSAGAMGKNSNSYLIFAYFNNVKQDIEDSIWIIPPASSSKVSINKSALGKFLLEKLEK